MLGLAQALPVSVQLCRARQLMPQGHWYLTPVPDLRFVGPAVVLPLFVVQLGPPVPPLQEP